mmetsp:Transcript_10347/g.26324  ORF Transcript_10347/g.26324 Transcript_10347/m.26324 type:complete len:99 (+) Transcript_10347:5460-5756(+)
MVTAAKLSGQTSDGGVIRFLLAKCSMCRTSKLTWCSRSCELGFIVVVVGLWTRKTRNHGAFCNILDPRPYEICTSKRIQLVHWSIVARVGTRISGAAI